MSSSDMETPEVKILSRAAKLTPPGYSIKLTEAQALEIAKIVAAPGWKVLKNVFVAQRKDHIARQSLSHAQTIEQLQYYKGLAAELQLFFLTVDRIKKAALKEDAAPEKDEPEF